MPKKRSVLPKCTDPIVRISSFFGLRGVGLLFPSHPVHFDHLSQPIFVQTSQRVIPDIVIPLEGFVGFVTRSFHADLAGCYCVNAGCGGDLVWRNATHMLKDIGGGIVGIIQKSSPDVLITKVSTDAASIRYYGQRASDAGINQGSAQIYFSGSQNPEQYYDPQGGALPVIEQILAQQADPASPYGQIRRAYDARLNPRQEKSCSISHAISIASSETLVISTHDTCSSLYLSGCVLDREQLCDHENKNCVLTVSDGNANGLSPIFPPVYVSDSDAGLSFAATATGNAISYEADGMNYLLASGPDLWWNIRREYLCDTGVAFPTDDSIDAAKIVSGSAEKTGNLISYDEYDPATGAITPQKCGPARNSRLFGL